MGRNKLRKEKPKSYGIVSILLGTAISAGLAYLVHYQAVKENLAQPLQGAIIAGGLFWVIFTLGIFMGLNIHGNRKYRKGNNR